MRIPSIAAAGAAFLLLFAAAVHLALPPTVAAPAAPRVRVVPVTALVARIEATSPLDRFAVNDLDPFVPFALRRPPLPTDRGPGTRSGPALVDDPSWTDGARPGAAPVRPWSPPPVVFAEPPSPRCIGVVRHSRGEVLTVRMRDGGDERRLRVGEELDGWRLLSLAGASATFLAPDGGLRTRAIVVETLPRAQRRG